MKRFDIQIKSVGKQAVLVEWPNRIDDAILDDIIRFTDLIKRIEASELINYTPAYNSLLLHYQEEIHIEKKKKELLKVYNQNENNDPITRNEWHIPVCYDPSFAPDLPLFEQKGMSAKEVIYNHTRDFYRVFMIGFLPGFLYLGKLCEELKMNRKSEPRLKVLKGSVGIAGSQTGIYPVDSPGGWQIIGRTPLSLFDITSEEPTPIRQGDNVCFYEIDLKTYQLLDSH